MILLNNLKPTCLIILLVTIISCKANNSIIGRWEYYSFYSRLTPQNDTTVVIDKNDSIYTHGNSFILEINANGTYNTKNSAGEDIPSKNGKYSIIDAKKALMGEDTVNYTFNGDTLTLSYSKIRGEVDMEENLKLIRQ